MSARETAVAAGLRVLDDAKTVYLLPNPAVAEEVITPALKHCSTFDLMVAYFSGAVLSEMSHGLASYLTRSDEPLRLLISPLLPEEDQAAIRAGLDPVEAATDALIAAFSDEGALRSALAQHTKKCLAYLLATGRLQMRVVIMRDGEFHPKQWIFAAGDDVAVLSGSANATQSAVKRNVEQLRLDLSWRSSESLSATREFRDFFETYWQSQKPDIAVTVEIADAVAQDLLRGYGGDAPPSENDYRKALAIDLGSSSSPAAEPQFRIPAGLTWETGDYRHQGEAVKAWEANGDQGVLAIATGGGKTICSMIAAQRLSERTSRLFILVSAPTRPLVAQWAKEMRDFGLEPFVSTDRMSMQEAAAQIDRRITTVDRGILEVDSAVVTNNLLTSPAMKRVLERHSGIVLLIGDEVHNLGSAQGVSTLPNVRFRMGLSATPESQYDPERDDALFSYFGDVVYTFGLDQAIGLCLVPYDYFVHQARLTSHEMDEYRDLSEKIRLLYGRLGAKARDSQRMTILLNARRRILEAAEDKIRVLRSCLSLEDPREIRHTLIYATDKFPEQLEDVNALLREMGIRFHQLTEEETSDARKVERLVQRFREGDIQVLTAKRVLDEGFNIPEISSAYILASTTVERQWTQRRGRILRLCPQTGKTKATLHDVIALPPANEPLDDESQKLVRGELMRVEEFARLSANVSSRRGAYAWVREAQLEYRVWID